MRLRIAAVALVISILPHAALTQARKIKPPRLEPSNGFALIDKRLTLLGEQETHLTEDKQSSSVVRARSMKRILESIEQTAFRLQSLYERRHERFGTEMFRVLRRRAAAVHRSLNSFEVARGGQVRGAQLHAIHSRILLLVMQFQAASGGYSALRCEPTQWTCCSPKRKQDLRPGESVACRWICVPRAQACTGFRGPRITEK
jgi:hypothetical protein